ncbi:MAG: Rpn family recombination-promoting nuclease/putative transposase [Runella slithyformis]|jgi:predicted transposase/invertase (TIGR01784 family)|nr:MAG: Rpn family recombination-promoting nuclease/putative transposase [Runella slithyformis]TAF95051.1 MAG: Rpn family recombination-promoting nuclease/putative transposase [Runella sp.]TAG18394.1 MAG: Rpn family recombination-promoting nuclease/putative transposase [Cytophagales bacterium]TAG37893.1 MAG: Rpn family recombination-promoting nuclease/putative transposase [Cytophagia bacterium]TAG79199.1 MAG: Rpn family recombination-promoting nuclease/putative transposase [Cytophagales bacteri
MSKYINPYTDFGFKKLFGEEANKDLLTDFLNQLLPEHHQIAALKFRNPEVLGEMIHERKAIFDIHCEAKSGEKFIVEMQKAKVNFFKDRSLFYATIPIREQARRGEWDFRLTPVYMIAILDFQYDENEERQKFLRSVNLKDQDGDVFYDKLTFKFIQMPLFTKGEHELNSHFDKWIYFLKKLESFDEIPVILKEPIFEKAFEVAEVAKMTPQQYEQYQESLLVYIEVKEVVKTAEMDGEKKKALAIAKELRQDGFSVEKIIKYTGLLKSEIDEL